MKTVLAISSQVVRGHVGLNGIGPALTALGVHCWPLPTVLISNHPGYKHGAGQTLDPMSLEEIIDGLAANGWLDKIDAVMSGYLPSADHVRLVRRVVSRLKRERDVTFLCDPVIGDTPKGLYMPQETAEAIRDELTDIADIITPNAFELAWLTGEPAASVTEAIAAARCLPNGLTVVATSVAAGKRRLANVLVEDGRGTAFETDRRDGVPNGTGDLFAGLLLGHVMLGRDMIEATGRTTEGVRVVVEASVGEEELRLVDVIGAAARATPDIAKGA